LEVKAFAIDLDGTMTDTAGIVNLNAAYATKWLQNAGYEIIFVSGKSSQEAFALASFLGTTKIAVGENGGVVQIGPNDLVLLGDKTYPLVAYGYLAERVKNVKLKSVFPRFTEVVMERTFDFNKGLDILEESKYPVYLSDSLYGYHITLRGVDKAKGLREALKYIKIKPENCVAIGDSQTDIPMFRMCGYSVAVGNASDDVKAEAKFSTYAENGDGAFEALEYVAERFLKVKLGELPRK